MSNNIVAATGGETVLPYVVSADVAGLMGRWAANNNLTVPSEAFFADMTNELAERLALATQVPVEVVSHRDMYEGMDKLVSESPYPVVSLDRAYFDDGHARIAGFLDVTRAVRETAGEDGQRQFEPAGDLTPRPGFPSLEQQLANLKEALGSTPITLVDDVIFSGDGAVVLVEKFKAIGLPIANIIAGIGIKEGIDKLRAAGVVVSCVKSYDDVADEVCERDFLAGVPMSGRTVVGDEGAHWSAPYFEPYGNPEKWASIPSESQRAMSLFCLSQSLRLWDKMEELNGGAIADHDVPRPLKGANGQPITERIWQDYSSL